MFQHKGRGALLLLTGLLMLSLSSLAISASDRLAPGSQAQQETSCVAPVPQMRRQHMSLLKHDRVETVHKGDRSVKFSLSGCIACHAGKDQSGAFIAVNQPGQFCAGCHQKLAVQPTCFQCHSAVPEEKQVNLNDRGRTLQSRVQTLEALPDELQELAQAHSAIPEK